MVGSPLQRRYGQRQLHQSWNTRRWNSVQYFNEILNLSPLIMSLVILLTIPTGFYSDTGFYWKVERVWSRNLSSIMESGKFLPCSREHGRESCQMEGQKPVYFRVTNSSRQRIDGELIRFVGVQGVWWDKAGTGRAEGYTFLCGQGNENLQLRAGFLYTENYDFR